jgi:hypothetical protein
MSVTITEQEAREAFDTFSLVDWDEIEALLPEGAVDTTGAPIDRHNWFVRLAAIAEALGLARGAESGAGMEQLSNPVFESACEALLRVYDRMQSELS